MAVYLSPVGNSATPTANVLDVLVTLKERLCHAYSVNASTQATANVEFTAGTPEFNGTTVFVPITAQGTITTPSRNCGCNPNVEVFTEKFYVAFVGQTANATAVTIVVDGERNVPSNIDSCGCAHSFVLDTALTITITPGTAAAAAANVRVATSNTNSK